MEAGTHASTLDETEIVERVARIISSVRGAKPDYAGLAAELAPAIAFDIFGVVLLRHDRMAVRVTVCKREGESWGVYYRQHPLPESRLEQMLKQPRIHVENYPEGADGPPARVGDALSNYPQLRSTVIVPLMVEDHVLGALELGSINLGTYEDEAPQRLIRAVARVLATAIESVQVGGNLEIQNRQRQALKDVSSALTSTMDLTTILKRIVEGVAETLHVASAIVTLDRQTQSLRLEAQSQLNPETMARVIGHQEVLTESCIIGYTLRHHQPHVSNDIELDTRFPSSRLLATELGMHSVFVYPLITETSIYGALLLCSPDAGGFTPLKSDILSLFASQATIAIRNGKLLESARLRKRFQEMIEQLEQARQQGSIEEELQLFKQVRQKAQQTFGVSFASLLSFLSDHLLTRPEQNLQAMLDVSQQSGQTFSDASEMERLLSPNLQLRDPHSQEESVALLTQTAEEALERAGVLSDLSHLTQLHERLPGHLSDAWFAADLDGNCFYMNPAAEGLCSFRMSAGDTPDLEEVFAEPLTRARAPVELRAYLSDLIWGVVPQASLRCVFAAESGPGSPPAKVVRERRAELTSNAMGLHTDRHCLLSSHLVHDQKGLLKAYALQVHDITEQVRDEQNKSALLSSVSHDLRSPLTTIKAGISGLLQPDIPWEEQDRREILEEIDAETDHLNVLVSALVELSRIEMGALSLEKEWSDLAELLDGTLSRLKRVLGKHRVILSLRPPLPLLAHVDYVQIERVFYNLLEHLARHSQEEATITLNLEIVDEVLHARLQAEKYLVPPEDYERLFKTFYNLDLQGNGLSLAICKGIIEAHQGRIEVEPLVDGGACFVFSLPTTPTGTC